MSSVEGKGKVLREEWDPGNKNRRILGAARDNHCLNEIAFQGSDAKSCAVAKSWGVEVAKQNDRGSDFQCQVMLGKT